jgi:transcriptional regulator with PAS, ATPase and Fis domain
MAEPREAHWEPSDLRQRLKWSFLLRVLIVSVLSGLVLLFLSGKPESDSVRAAWLGGLILLGYLHALAGLIALPRIGHPLLLSYLSIAFDLVWVSACLLLTGGAQSPFPFLYNLVVLNGSVLFLQRGALATALFATLGYGIVHTFSSGGGDMQRLFPFVVNVSSYFSIAFLGGYLAKRVAEANRLLERQSQAYGQLVSLKDTLVQNLDCGIFVADPSGGISYLNKAAEEMLQTNSQRCSGKTLGTIIPEMVVSGAEDGSAKMPTSGEIGVEISGSKKSLTYNYLPLTGQSGAGLGSLLILQDVTQIRRDQEERQKEEELKRKWIEQKNLGEAPEFFEIVGRTLGLQKVFHLIKKTGSVSANVLITGESGTGKELVARAIHGSSNRNQGRFVAVNCGAIPENLMESELFGHIRGAFTGAVVDRPGLFVEANGGTIFFDEIGDLPLHLQVKLLRVLQERAVTPVGSNRPIKVDVRVISATNRDLAREVALGHFREDIYFRLNVIRIPLPPLRERLDDIPSLVDHFLKIYSQGKMAQISPKALNLLMSYLYPGNVRELENIIEHACAMSASCEIDIGDLPDLVFGKDSSNNKGDTSTKTLIEVEKAYILKVLEMTNWRIRGEKGAAALLGLRPTTLASRLKSLGISRPANMFFRRPDDISSA